MSLVKIQGNASGTGTLTIAAPNTNTDRTLTLPDQTATLITNSADVLNIGSGQVYKDASGNVGIGTSSPSTRLHVVVPSGVNDVARFRSDNATSDVIIGASAANVGMVYAPSGQGLALGTNGSERARIDSSGNLLVGTTSAVLAGYVNNFKASNNVMAIQRSGGTEGVCIAFANQSGSATGSIYNYTSSTNYNTTSDYRLKEDVQPMTGALAKVAALKPCTYKWKLTGESDQGFIAHELAEVCPGAVTGAKDALDSEGNPQYQGIDTSFLVATLTAAIQELKAIVDAQGAEIAALKGTA